MTEEKAGFTSKHHISQLHRSSNELILATLSDVRRPSLQKPFLLSIFSIRVSFHAQLAASADREENNNNSHHCQSKKESVQSFLYCPEEERLWAEKIVCWV